MTAAADDGKASRHSARRPAAADFPTCAGCDRPTPGTDHDAGEDLHRRRSRHHRPSDPRPPRRPRRHRPAGHRPGKAQGHGRAPPVAQRSRRRHPLPARRRRPGVGKPDRQRSHGGDRCLHRPSRRVRLGLRLCRDDQGPGRGDCQVEARCQSRLLAAGTDRRHPSADRRRPHARRRASHLQWRLRLFRRRTQDGRGLCLGRRSLAIHALWPHLPAQAPA